MYGYTMHAQAPIEVYDTLHAAVVDIVGDGIEGLVLHLARPTESGFDLTEVWESKEQVEDFNRTVIPQAMARAGLAMDGPPPEIEEFDPVVVITPRPVSWASRT